MTTHKEGGELSQHAVKALDFLTDHLGILIVSAVGLVVIFSLIAALGSCKAV